MATTGGFNENFVPPWHVKSNADDNANVQLWADPTTHRLLVDSVYSPSLADVAVVTSVSDTASSTTLLASNTSRLGAVVFNDSSSDLYVKLGTTASTTSFSYKLSPYETVEIPFGYTGRIDGIWSSDSTGAARITELT